MHGPGPQSAANGPRERSPRPAPSPRLSVVDAPALSAGTLGHIAFPGASAEGEPDAPARGRTRFSRGLPMIELVLVCAVVTALVFLGLREYRQAVLRARAATAAADVSVIRDGLLRYYSDCHDFPMWDGRPGDPGLLKAPAGTFGLWGGPYLREWPRTTPLGGRFSYHHHEGPGGEPVLEIEGIGRAEALQLARALGGGVILELEPLGTGARAPERWTVRLDLARRLGSRMDARRHPS